MFKTIQWEKIAINILFVLMFIVTFFITSSVFAQNFNSYNRTPSGVSFSQTTVNFSGVYESNLTEILGYKMAVKEIGNVNLYFSSCVDNTGNTNIVTFNENIILPIGDFEKVFLYLDQWNTDCSGDLIEEIAETGNPAFSIVSPASVSFIDSVCTTVGSVETCLYNGVIFYAIIAIVLYLLFAGVLVLLIYIGKKLL